MASVRSKLTVLLGAALCIGGLAGTAASPATAATTSNLKVITLGGDYFHNYDFLSKDARGNNVDWPTTVFFTGNATINKAKSSVEAWSNQFDDNSTKAMYMSMRDSSGDAYTWDQDNGKKTPACPYYGSSSPHYRIYGIGTYERLYNTTLGYWVPATTHRDYSECASNGAFFAQTEQTEDLLVNEVADNTSVQRDYWSLYNAEPLRDEGNHRWENGGTASTVRIP